MTKTKMMPVDEGHASELMNDVSGFYFKKELTDVDLYFPAVKEATRSHRLILAGISNLLSDAFRDIPLEVEPILIFPDCAKEDVEAFLKLIYTGVCHRNDLKDTQSLSDLLTLLAVHDMSIELTEMGSTSGSYSCSHCHLTFKRKINLNKHRSQFHGLPEDDGETSKVPEDIIASKNASSSSFRRPRILGRSNVEKQQSPSSSPVPPSSSHDIECSICFKKFQRKYLLAQHMKCHIGTYKCTECTESFRFSLLLTRHMKLKHQGEHQCPDCPTKFGNAGALEHHIREEHDIGFEYDDLLNSEWEAVHIKEKHPGPYNCKVCNKDFDSYDEYKEHMILHEASESAAAATTRKVQCKLCNESFRLRSELKKHLTGVHKEEPERLPCKICEKLIVARRMSDHVKHVHKNHRPLTCQVCQHRCSKKSELRNHMRTHTGERPFVCDICGSRFSYSHILLRHKKFHMGVKPYKCTECEKAFLQKADLTKHIRGHTGEKPYACDVCSRKFARLDYMRKHRVLHAISKTTASSSSPSSNTFKYSCSECQMISGSHEALKRHINSVHSQITSSDHLIADLNLDDVDATTFELAAGATADGRLISSLQTVEELSEFRMGDEGSPSNGKMQLMYVIQEEDSEVTPILTFHPEPPDLPSESRAAVIEVVNDKNSEEEEEDKDDDDGKDDDDDDDETMNKLVDAEELSQISLSYY